MTDSMKFGPEWLRNMKSDSSGIGGGCATVQVAPTPIKMAEFRYGREEMLALFDRAILPPDPLKQMQGLYVEKTQMPLALIQMTEEETRMWNRGINSDVVLRLSKPGPGAGAPGTRGALGGRGGSVDRGRGRARGSYHYSRGLSYEESDTTNGYSRGVRNYERTQSQGNWGERNGGDPGEYTATSPRKEFGSRNLSDTNWRRHRGGGEEEDGWRATRNEKWGRGSSNSWREGDNNNWDRSRPWEENSNSSHPPTRKPWENEDNLPEWATENPSESGGSFDASGAFHGGTVYSDEEESGTHFNNQRPLTRTEQVKSNSSQQRPAPHSKKEPPNITNGTSTSQQETGSSENVKASVSSNAPPLRQSQSVTSIPTDRRPTHNPITTSASFTAVNNITRPVPESKSLRVEPPKPSMPTPRQLPAPVSNLQSNKPVEVASPPEPKEEKPNREEEIEQRLLDVFVSTLMDEEEKEPPPLSTASPQTPAHMLSDALWFYQDPQGNVQGPFQSSEMSEWHTSGYFKGSLLVRRACDERYSPLSELIKLWKGIPFMLDYYLVPPIKATEPVLPLPMVDDPMLIHYQIQQRLIHQRQAVAKLNQSEHFTNLSHEQQQLIAHQAQVEAAAQAQAGLIMGSHPHTTSHTSSNVLAMIQHLSQYQQLHQQRQASQVPVTAPTDPQVDPIQQLMAQMGMHRPPTTPQNTPVPEDRIEQFMNVFRQRLTMPPPQTVTHPQTVTMDSVWGGTTSTPAFPAWSAPPGHAPPTAPQSLWADSMAKGIKTEQEILEEQLRLEEKKKNEELRKQEELQKLREEEEERHRQKKEEEELEKRRKEEEEKENKRIQAEEDRKKKEAAAAKKAEQDRIRKEEEKKRKEEDKKRKEEEKKRQEEEKRKAEEEKKRLEEEKKKREEMTKKQNEALKRLQEQQQQQQQQQQQARAVKPTPAPWAPPESTGTSLADIQKTERKQQQQLREQQEMLKAYQEKHLQEQQQKSAKSGSTSAACKWAGTASAQPARIKSLAEIQAEEHERMAKQAEKEKAERMAASKEVNLPVTCSIWATANQTLRNSNTASVWGNSTVANSVGGGGARFWDEVNTKPTKPTKSVPQQQPQVKSQAKVKANKEEASVMKLFDLPKTSKTDDFNKWCTMRLSSSSSQIDIPTFVDFLLTVESHKEVREYCRMYMGETKDANDFASEFIDRRARLQSADKHGHRPEPQQNPTNHFQEVKNKNKKIKKSKMTKVDSRILGFNVTAAPDRINVGDRDYGEGL